MQQAIDYFNYKFPGCFAKPSGFFRITNPLSIRSKEVKDKSMGIDLSKNFVHCFREEYKNSVLGFVMDYEECTYKEAVELVGVFSSSVIRRGMKVAKKIKYDHLPSSLTLLTDSLDICVTAQNFLVDEKGLDPAVLQRKGWTVCSNFEDKFYGRIIIPYFRNNKIVYYSGRTTIGWKPKYLNVSAELCGNSASTVFYNEDALNMYDSVYLVEGAIDAETLGDNAIARSGWNLSADQMSMIVQSSCKEIRIVPDKGFLPEAIRVAMKLMEHKDTYIDLVPGDHKDVNDSRGELIKMQSPFKIGNISKLKECSYDPV